MGKNQQLQLPPTPTYQQPQLGMANNSLLSDYGKHLSSGDFSGNLSWLKPTINNNNSALALSAAQGVLQPQFRNTLQQINNNAAANNQLNSSTYTDALARSQSDLNSQYQSIVSNQAINDNNQSNQNRLSLFGQGLNTLQGTIGNDVGMTQNQNSFNLENYQNQVATTIQNNQNANNANGWQQLIGGLSPIGHDYLQSQGINQVPGYGVGQTLGMISTALPFMGGGQAPAQGQGLSGISTNPYGQQSGFNLSQGGINSRYFNQAPFAGAYASN